MSPSTRFRTLLFSGIAIFALLLASCGGSTEDEMTGSDTGSWDGPIIFGEGGFDSVQFHTRVAQFIVENGYGYETENILAETVAMGQGMLNDDIHVNMEMWAEQTPAFGEGVESGQLVDLGSNYEESIQGWFVPTYMIEGDPERGIEPVAPDLRHVDDLVQYKDLFRDPEQPDKGRFYNCIAGWECQVINDNKLAAYGLDEHFRSFLPGSDAALAGSLVRANERGEPWFGYYWAPTWIFAQLDLTLLEEPEYTDECWEQIFDGDEGCAYPSVRVQVAATTEFAEAVPEVAEFLTNYSSTMDETSEVLLYMLENDAPAEEAALWWLENNQETWTSWVPEDVAERVTESLEGV